MSVSWGDSCMFSFRTWFPSSTSTTMTTWDTLLRNWILAGREETRGWVPAGPSRSLLRHQPFSILFSTEQQTFSSADMSLHFLLWFVFSLKRHFMSGSKTFFRQSASHPPCILIHSTIWWKMRKVSHKNSLLFPHSEDLINFILLESWFHTHRLTAGL